MNKTPDVALSPPGVTTRTATAVPEVPDGLFTVRSVPERTVIVVPVFAPKYTAVAPVSALPLTVTTVPPLGGPLAGETAITVGTCKRYL